jgi:type VI secretion system secreted protein VgrG
MALNGLPIKQDSLDVKIHCSTISEAVIMKAEIVEGVSSLSKCDVFLQTTKDINIAKIVNSIASISLKVHDRFTRYFSGIIEMASFENIPSLIQSKTDNILHIRIVPTLSRTSYTQRHRSFQDLPTKDIIQRILKENGIANTLQLSRDNKRSFCVQYGESDFHFLSRLMEEEGGFYYFEHELSKDTLKISDKSVSGKKISTELKIMKKTNSALWQLDGVYNVAFKSSIGTKKIEVASFNELTAKIVTGVSSDTSNSEKIGEKEIYGVPFFEKTSGDDLAKTLRETDNCVTNQLTGYTHCPEMGAGNVFKISGSRTAIHNGEFFTLSVKHFINQIPEEHDTPIYYNEFTAIPSDTPFHSRQLHYKNRIAGCQTAIVTGISGEEIFCNEDSKIKIKFHWDSNAQNDEKSSCWVRVAQSWAGNNFGSLIIPRVGMEVVIVFADGDPDQPMVVGCVYNGANKPPSNYAKEQKTVSTFFSNTSSGGNGFNEIRFNDKANEEEVFVHAQKDMNVVIENSVTETLNEGTKSIILESKKDPTSYSLTIKKGAKIVTLNEGDYSVTLDQGNQSVTLKKGNQTVVLSDGNLKIDVTGSISIIASDDINLKANGAININSSKSTSVDSKDSVIVKATKDFNVNSAKTTLKSQMATEISCLSAKVNAQTTCNIAALSLKIEAKANLDISAMAAATVKSTALLQLQGTAGVALSGAMIKLG